MGAAMSLEAKSLEAKKKNKIQVKVPSQERSKQTVSNILEACSRLIIREGYYSITTDKIAQEAGVSIGSLYQFFGNKESVVSALIKKLIDEDRESYFKQMRDYAHLAPADKIPKMLEIGFAIYQQQPELRSALQSVRLYLTEQDYVVQSRATFTEFLLAHLQHIKAPRSPEKVAYIAVTAFLGIMNSTSHDSPDLVKDPVLRDELIIMFKKYLELE